MTKVFVVMLSLKFNLEDSQYVVSGVERWLKGRWWTKKAAYMQRSISYVVVARGITETELVDRLRPEVERVGGTERFWVFEAPKFAISSEGGTVDPFRGALIEANEELRRPTYFKNMHQPQRSGRFGSAVKYGERGTVGQVGGKFGGMGNPPKKPDHP